MNDGAELYFKVSGSTTTINAQNGSNGFTLNAGIVDDGVGGSRTLAGQVYLGAGGGIFQDNQGGPNTLTIASNVTSGTASGPLSLGGNISSSYNYTYVLSGSNSYTGATDLLGGTVKLANSAASRGIAARLRVRDEHRWGRRHTKCDARLGRL